MGNSHGKPVCFDDEVNLNHFRLLRVVGKGAFGKVRIVERKDTGLTFALKYIRKDEGSLILYPIISAIARPLTKFARYSYSVGECAEYSTRTADVGALELPIHLQFTLQFSRCGVHVSSSRFNERRRPTIPHIEKDVHGRGSPVLDRRAGNVASDYTPGKPLTSKSGTLAYLAPEVYTGHGYGPGADWWSLGVLFYECIYNKRPFEGNTHSVLAAQITKANPNFPVTAPPVSMPCLHAISSALEEDPGKRMGSVSFESFTDNPFFRAIDFDALERKEIEPVFVPSGEKTNFDATYDLEELLLEEAPLEARARRQKPREQLREDATVKEIREEELYKMIETGFTPFDYTTAAYERYAKELDPNSTETSDSPVDSTGPGGPERSGNTSAPQSITGRPTSRARKVSKSQPSLSGSPPIPNNPPPLPNGRQTTTSAPSHRPANNRTHTSTAASPSTIQPYQPSYSRPRQPGTSQKESIGGGMNVILGETESWSELAKKDATLPLDAKLSEPELKPNGMLGFLSRKRGRGHSPKPQERGILGKEGARVVISK
ncbi:Protein kinase-like (PK-like) [Venustampulla echinocandica]|uniref:non-specific serine/threonine protein kinase n=1 Tax=Venustampulla echinocandica TaxID=2656787 RepID=A0A370TNU7_9HELO|nr:Protein kinase-like (PK-like) [Venustampulla echinocandica]RDL37196.1 Protein kinase-like (PK-like) [Venustampulla echinocandica]